jgi:hypothetical protein
MQLIKRIIIKRRSAQIEIDRTVEGVHLVTRL